MEPLLLPQYMASRLRRRATVLHLGRGLCRLELLDEVLPSFQEAATLQNINGALLMPEQALQSSSAPVKTQAMMR